MNGSVSHMPLPMYFRPGSETDTKGSFNRAIRHNSLASRANFSVE
jgi:hypothetical protein